MPECLNTDVLILFVSTGLVRITDKRHNCSFPTPPQCIVSTAPCLLWRILIIILGSWGTKQTIKPIKQLCTSRVALCFSYACQVNTANSRCAFSGRQVCRTAADWACAVHWTVAQRVWQKSILSSCAFKPVELSIDPSRQRGCICLAGK